jgi:hypothetical protein
LVALLISCGGGGNGSEPEKKTRTPAATYAMSIEAKAGSVIHSTIITLIVK